MRGSRTFTAGEGTHAIVVVLRNVSVACPADGSVVVRDLYLASAARPTQAFEIELRDHVVLPALVNAHDHLHQNGVPPLPLTTPFRNSYEWAAAFRDHFANAAVKAALSLPLRTRLWHGGLKNALCGATTVMHHDPAHDTFDVTSFPVRVSQPYTWAHSLHQGYGPKVVASFSAGSPEVPWFIHIGEGTDTLAAGELQELRQLGCLGGNTVLIHAVGLGDNDVVDILRAGAGVVWCPSSNLALLGQTISPRRLRALFEAGCLALGTDSRLTGARDLLAELEIAAAHSDFSPRELLQLVTERALRLLRTTESADCIVVRDRASDPFGAFLGLQRAQLRAVVRGGEPFITDPDFADWFVRLGIPCTAVWLDGQPKLCRSDALSYRGVATWPFEPGFTLQ
jgi:cytosine/adenosine deaminase-related metal-dependent hydrolase